MDANDTIEVTIMSPSEIVWHGHATSLSAHNSEGVFDVLPDHARFVTLIDPLPITISTHEGDQSFTFNKAVLFFEDNRAKIYIH